MVNNVVTEEKEKRENKRKGKERRGEETFHVIPYACAAVDPGKLSRKSRKKHKCIMASWKIIIRSALVMAG